MSKIARYQGNVRAFASDAQGLERTVFGGTNQADDLTSQITASFLRGWGIVGASEHPSLEDFNAAMYAMSQFIAYQHQMGVPEWHSEQEYHIGSICTHDGESYQSLLNANVGSQPPSAKWTPVLTSKNGLTYLGLGKTDTPEFGGLKAPSITLRDGKISLTSSTDGTTLVFTVSGEPVAEIKAGSFFHKKIISAGEVLQSPKYIFRDGDIIFYSGPNNLVMQVDGKDVATLTPENFYHVKQVAAAESLSAPKVILRPGDVNLVSGKNNLVIQVGGNDVATLTPENFYHVKQVAAAESLKAPKVILRDGDVNLISGANNLVIQVGGNDVATLTPENFYHVKQVAAAESLKAPKVILRDGDVNLISGANNLVIQVGGNDVATLTPENFYHVKQVAAAESLKAPKVILRDGDVNLISGANNLVIQVGGNDIASLTPGNNFFKGKLTAETSLQVGSTCILATDGNLTGSKWGGWLDAFMKDGMSTDGNGLWWDAFSSQLQFRIGDFNIADAAGGAGTSVTFPKAFKNGCLMVIPVPGNGGAAQQIGSQSYSSSGAVLQKGASDISPRSGKYLAVGY
ncbi:hypothetical protein AI2602V1_2169 [Citrobacter freundii]|uniref:gp53-like domain-containing protein n=1 Tax=Citrobacter freundii TaxID=546 RepID=UPI001D947FF1|nr:hypothetical protein [Citrobacter freundii]CAE6130134.1 hypothetical protein AI2602V1_2169 [Citrobacter freundii]CAH3291010.1 hypothetical protein AI2602V1_2169 [Citrobacter freundii]CAH6041810.1 hypothetical protein AI3058V1_2028 [Citrobacter freundii]